MDRAELVYSGASVQATLVARGEVSAREVTEACLAQISRLDPSLNAFRDVYAEEALAAADEADHLLAQGDRRPLLGVPVALKDDIAVAGRITGRGTSAVRRPAAVDSPVVRLLREAGAVVLGKTHLPELAVYGFTETRSFGITRNPWDLRRTPGGSSGGSAVAVAAGMVGIASASDGAGSIRIPAACCGLFGLKPSAGRTVGSGGWGGLSVQGAMTRSVADAALYVDLIGDPGADHLVPSVGRDPGPLVIGVSTTPMRVGLAGTVDAEMSAVVQEYAGVLTSLGHRIREVELPLDRAAQEFSLRYLRAIHDSADDLDDPRRLERRTRDLVRIGGAVPHRAAERALRSGERDTGRLADALRGVDLLLTPVLNRLPVEVGRWSRAGGLRTALGMARVYGFTALWNHSGRPAASVPAGLSRGGLPLSVQLVGRRDHDAEVVAVCAQVEQARPWAHLRPRPRPRP
ncbi:MAG: amidase family protein [Nocardioidaceae bacterium]